MLLSTEEDKNLKILVVEDESIVALDLTRNLKKIGFTPLIPVNSGKKALESVRKNEPDLVILDIKIKGNMDGIQTAEEIKKVRSLPFIFFSAFNDQKTLKRVKQTEPYGFIPKNSNNIDLYTTVKIALQRFSIEKEIHSKDRILSTTLQSITDAVIGVNREGRIITWNKGAETIFGWKDHEVFGTNISIITPSYIPNEIPGIIEDLSKEGTVKRYDSICQNKENRVLNVSTTISPIHELDGKISGFSLVIKDVSEKKELEKQIIDILEEERFRIGRDLHDNLGQYLTGILLKLKVLERNLVKNEMESDKDLVLRISSHVKMVLEKMRELSRGLTSPGFQNINLNESLEELASYFSNVHNLKIKCKSTIEKEVKDNRVITQLYHIAQEAITNAVKYADCSSIGVSLSCNETEIIMKIKDNGKGFDTKDSKGLGLKIMKYRADMINGQLQIFSSRETGTTVSCSIPKALLRSEK